MTTAQFSENKQKRKAEELVFNRKTAMKYPKVLLTHLTGNFPYKLMEMDTT